MEINHNKKNNEIKKENDKGQFNDGLDIIKEDYEQDNLNFKNIENIENGEQEKQENKILQKTSVQAEKLSTKNITLTKEEDIRNTLAIETNLLFLENENTNFNELLQKKIEKYENTIQQNNDIELIKKNEVEKEKENPEKKEKEEESFSFEEEKELFSVPKEDEKTKEERKKIIKELKTRYDNLEYIKDLKLFDESNIIVEDEEKFSNNVKAKKILRKKK